MRNGVQFFETGLATGNEEANTINLNSEDAQPSEDGLFTVSPGGSGEDGESNRIIVGKGELDVDARIILDPDSANDIILPRNNQSRTIVENSNEDDRIEFRRQDLDFDDLDIRQIGDDTVIRLADSARTEPEDADDNDPAETADDVPRSVLRDNFSVVLEGRDADSVTRDTFVFADDEEDTTSENEEEEEEEQEEEEDGGDRISNGVRITDGGSQAEGRNRNDDFDLNELEPNDNGVVRANLGAGDNTYRVPSGEGSEDIRAVLELDDGGSDTIVVPADANGTIDVSGINPRDDQIVFEGGPESVDDLNIVEDDGNLTITSNDDEQNFTLILDGVIDLDEDIARNLLLEFDDEEDEEEEEGTTSENEQEEDDDEEAGADIQITDGGSRAEGGDGDDDFDLNDLQSDDTNIVSASLGGGNNTYRVPSGENTVNSIAELDLDRNGNDEIIISDDSNGVILANGFDTDNDSINLGNTNVRSLTDLEIINNGGTGVVVRSNQEGDDFDLRLDGLSVEDVEEDVDFTFADDDAAVA